MGLTDDILGGMKPAVTAALLEAGHLVAEAARRNMPVGSPDLDPDKEVALRESVNVTPDGFGGVIVSVDTPYAAKHEFDMRLRHPRGGGPRYLARAVAEVAPALSEIVAGKVDASTAAGLISDPSRSHHTKL